MPLARDRFALDPGLVYLNHAAVGVLPIATREALHAMIDGHARSGLIGTLPTELAIASLRADVGRFVGASGDEIAFLRNTGDGATVIAQGAGLVAGDEVITGRNEFGSNALPWLALRDRGIGVRFIDAPRERMTPEVLAGAMTARTKIVAVSWVTFDDGYRHDLATLAEVAHAGGALFVVDAIQGLGAFPLDVRDTDIDALYAGGAKWLMALQGVSFLYVRASLLDRIATAMPGWRSVRDMWDFFDYDQPLVPNASRYEGGTPNYLGALSLATSMRVLAEADVEKIGGHVLALTDALVDGLQRRGARVISDRSRPESASGIVQFIPQSDPVELGQRLGMAGICVTYRASGIRVAPHGYNTIDEIEALLEHLAY